MIPINHFQVLVNRVSGNNLFQYRMFANFMAKWILAAMILFSLNFFYYTPDFTCTDQESTGYNTCKQFVCSVQSQQFWIDHMEKPLPKSITLDYGIIMVCSQEWISSLLQSLCYIGSLVGYIFMPLIADNRGRKLAQFLSWIFAFLGCIVLLVSPNLSLVGIGTFMMGFGANAAITLHYSFIKELARQQIGQRMMICLQISFSFGVFLIALVSWLVSDWKYALGLTIILPYFLVISTSNWIEQTPQFNLAKGRQCLLKSLNKISQTNNGQVLSLQDLEDADIQCQRGKQNMNLSFIDLFRHQSLLKLTIFCGMVNFIIEFTYDGTIFSLDKIGIDVYLNQMLVGLVEISGAVFASYIVPKVQRKKYCQISFILISLFTSILGILSLVENHQKDQIDAISIFQMIVLGCLRITLNAVWGIFFVFVAELYPAQITSVSFGWVSIIGTVGATISPFIKLATAQFALFLMAILNLGNFFLIKKLNQTKGKPIRFRIKERQTLSLLQSSILSQ